MPKTESSRMLPGINRKANLPQYHWEALFDPDWVGRHRRVLSGDNALGLWGGEERHKSKAERENFMRTVERMTKEQDEADKKKGLKDAVEKGIKDAD